MKVYIVTSGEYSSYGIERVFLDKEKAELYARLHKTGYGEFQVEEHDTFDDNIVASEDEAYYLWFRARRFEDVFAVKKCKAKMSLKPEVQKLTYKQRVGCYEVTIPITAAQYSRMDIDTMCKVANDKWAEIEDSLEGVC